MVALLVSAALVIVGCGDAVDSGGGPVASQVVGSTGGTVTVAGGTLDGTELTAPPGALGGDVTIEISTAGDIMPPSGLNLTGPAASFIPAATAFGTPATVVLPYDSADLLPGATTDDLVVLWEDANGTVTVLVVTSVDTTNNFVTVEVSELGTFQVAVNDSVTANDDMANIDEDDAAGVIVNVVGNDVDAQGDALMVTVETQPANGMVVDNSDGTVTYTPSVDFNGDDTFTYSVADPTFGTDTATVTVIVAGVNDAPSFSLGSDETVLEDAGSQTVAGWATGISAGPADEEGQVLTFNVTANTNPTLFAVAPAIDPATGNLTYTPAANANGTADITITLSDDGGTANGGVDTSAPVMFTVTVTVNEAGTVWARGREAPPVSG